MMSIFGIASRGGWLREVGCFNTTTTALAVKLVRCTAVGTPGAGITISEWDPDGAPASLTPFTTHSTDATIGDSFNFASIGAAIGAGVIWTFWSDHGIKIPTGTANGMGLILATGTGQVCDMYMTWQE
jgi:hypothetical protein